jgi:hypothetical protein
LSPLRSGIRRDAAIVRRGFIMFRPAEWTLNVEYATRDIILVVSKAKATGEELLNLNIGDPDDLRFQNSL